jgi:hypothetical protein
MTEHEIAMRSWSILNPGATQQQYLKAAIEVSRLRQDRGDSSSKKPNPPETASVPLF